MGKTCAVAFCNSGYKTNAKIKMHTFPADESEREKWMNALPNIIDPSKKLNNNTYSSMYETLARIL